MLARAQNLLKREKFFAAFRTDGQVLFHTGEGPLKWKTCDLALCKFTDVALAFGAVEFMLAGLSNHADQAFNWDGALGNGTNGKILPGARGERKREGLVYALPLRQAPGARPISRVNAREKVDSDS